MNIRKPKASRRAERGEAGLTPMIDVVFMLLIFFMLISQVTPPEPFPVTLPKLPEAAEPQSDGRLYVDATGRPGYDGEVGPAALDRLAERGNTPEPLQIRADAQLEAATLAALLKDVSQRGIRKVEVMVGQ